MKRKGGRGGVSLYGQYVALSKINYLQLKTEGELRKIRNGWKRREERSGFIVVTQNIMCERRVHTDNKYDGMSDVEALETSPHPPWPSTNPPLTDVIQYGNTIRKLPPYVPPFRSRHFLAPSVIWVKTNVFCQDLRLTIIWQKTMAAAGEGAAMVGRDSKWDWEPSVRPCDPRHVEDMAEVRPIAAGDTAVGPEKAGAEVNPEWERVMWRK